MKQLFVVLAYIFLAMGTLYVLDPSQTNDKLAVFFFVLGAIFLILE